MITDSSHSIGSANGEVLQGSALGPVLFLHHADDIPATLNSNITCIIGYTYI